MAVTGRDISWSLRLDLLGLILLLFYSSVSDSKVLEGELTTEKDWIFLARFCFLSEKGRLRFRVEYPQEYEVQNFLLYYDEPDQWESVYKTGKNCLQREAALVNDHDQIINITSSYTAAGCILESVNTGADGYVEDNFHGTTAYYTCSSGLSFTSVRERWWYVALSNCQSTKGLILRYYLKMTNGDSYWTEHFSADEFYILPTDIAFLVLFFILWFLSLIVTYKLKSKDVLHTTFKMYIMSVTSYAFALLLLVAYYAGYATDGIGEQSVNLAGRVFQLISNLTFLLMLILMGKGYTITRGRISRSGSIKITIFMSIYVITYAVLFIYEAEVFDPGEVLYFYESPGGYGVIALQLLGWLWFCYAVVFTLKHYPEKKGFYMPFFAFYSLWFVATPFTIMVATYALDKWVRAGIVNIIELIIAFLAMSFFLFLTRPSAANSNFPYHIRTSQIGVINEPNGNVPCTDVDSFPHQSDTNEIFQDDTKPANSFTEMFTVTTEHNHQTKVPLPDRTDRGTKGSNGLNNGANGLTNGTDGTNGNPYNAFNNFSTA